MRGLSHTNQVAHFKEGPKLHIIRVIFSPRYNLCFLFVIKAAAAAAKMPTVHRVSLGSIFPMHQDKQGNAARQAICERSKN
jgi:hypothetical protein